MVKYYYDKYNTNVNTTYDEPPIHFGSSSSIPTYSENFKNKRWSFILGKYELTNQYQRDERISVGDVGYKLLPDSLQQYEALEEGFANQSIESERWEYILREKKEVITYSKGSLAQSNLEAENGTYPTDGRHTDGYWYIRKGVVNQNPVITPVGTVPSGAISVKPSFNYKVTDPDGNTMTVTESIDGITFNTRTGVASGTQLTFTPTDLAWLRTRIKQTVNLTIKADDGKGGVTTSNYPITRTTPAIDMQLKTPFETDIAARRLLIKLEGSLPIDANVSVQACNNAFDTSPTWENATSLVLSGFPYLFTNKTKTAAKWGVSFKVRIERGSSTQPIYLDYLGGAFD